MMAERCWHLLAILRRMEASDWIFILGLPLLVLLLTGPGLWSENWGWGLFDRIFGRKKSDDSTQEKPPP
jgi:hypothetical protein